MDTHLVQRPFFAQDKHFSWFKDGSRKKVVLHSCHGDFFEIDRDVMNGSGNESHGTMSEFSHVLGPQAFPPSGMCTMEAQLHCQFAPHVVRNIEQDNTAKLRVEVARWAVKRVFDHVLSAQFEQEPSAKCPGGRVTKVGSNTALSSLCVPWCRLLSTAIFDSESSR